MNAPEGKAEDAPAPRRHARRRDRRSWERIPTRGPRASLSWRDGESERTIWGELVNLGGEGATFRADAVPPSGVPLWLGLEDHEPRGGRIDLVESRLVEAAVDSSGINVARLRFVGACPIEFFDLAVGRR